MGPRDLVLRNCIIFTATTCLIWDGLLSFSDEYKYIWRGPWTAVKVIYIFSRWFGITIQIINCALVSSPTFSLSQLPPEICRQWFGFQTFAGSCLLGTLVAVLALRVYALYNKDRRIGILLIVILSTTFIISVVLGILTVRALQFDGNCGAPTPPKEAAYFRHHLFLQHSIHSTDIHTYSVLLISVHSLMLILTIHKRNIGSHDGTRVPVIRVVIRDGAWVFIAVCAMLSVMVLYSFAIIVAAHVLFPWPITMVSIFTCRLVLNMQRLKVDDPEVHSDLTSCIDVDSSSLG
ncbi:hypothetical protein BDZ94DRAFT_1259404 [Collybia nuda]|uniref:DUF6533 domain-containing protein n=1 Tax=Collybia nuda TaxID=64659 RepID=A0A9P5Y4M7_9AGAR|nr:hypothetical protein BDZ94DRAFT_1259404 [Collybia nuda]